MDQLRQMPDYQAAIDFAALRRSLLNDDLTGARIAFAALTAPGEDVRSLLDGILARWTSRFALITSNSLSSTISLTMNDPLAGQSGKVIAADNQGVMLEIGVSSHVVPWGRIPSHDLLLLWQSIALREHYAGEASIMAVMVHLLAEDFMESRVLAHGLREAGTAPMTPSIQALLAWVERWSTIRLLMEAHLARINQDQAVAEDRMAKVKGLIQLGGQEWAVPILAGLMNESSSAATPHQPPDASPLIAIAGCDQLVKTLGNWASGNNGPLCSGGGSLRVADLGDATGLSMAFTPNSFHGIMVISIHTSSIAIDFDRSMLELRSPQSLFKSLPIALFPRCQNRVDIQFGNHQDPLRVRINRDNDLPTLAGIRGSRDLQVALSVGCDVRFQAIALNR